MESKELVSNQPKLEKLGLGTVVFVLHIEKIVETSVDKIVTTEDKGGIKIVYGLNGINNTVWLFDRKKLFSSREQLVNSL